MSKVGDTLTAEVVDLNGVDVDPATLDFAWFLDGEDEIEDETDDVLLVTSDMIGSTIKVVVTAENGNVFESEETEAVLDPSVISGVTIDNTTPKVGDTLTATVLDDNLNDITSLCSLQWYRQTNATESGKSAIPGATGATYETVTADIGSAIYVIAVIDEDEGYWSKSTAPVQGQEITGLSITGMGGKSGNSKENNVPLIGDILEAVTTPENAGSLVSYQWYRGDGKITGATGQTYQVTEDDQFNLISVVISALDKNAVTVALGADEAVTPNVACKETDDLDFTLSKTNGEVGDTITATVKDGTTALSAVELKYQWYRDQVDGDHKIAGATTKTYELTKADTDHDVILQIEGRETEGYYGKTTKSALGETKEIGAIRLSTDDKIAAHATANLVDGAAVTGAFGVGTTISASFADEKTTADFVWEINGNIVDETGSSYTIKAEDVGIDDANPTVTNIKVAVEAEGYGKYSGTSKQSFVMSTVANKSTIVMFDVYKASDPTKTALAAGDDVNIGDELVVRTYPASAADAMTFTWKFVTNATTATVSTRSGQSFIVPENVKIAANTVLVDATYTSDEDDNLVPSTDSYSITTTTRYTAGTGVIDPTTKTQFAGNETANAKWNIRTNEGAGATATDFQWKFSAKYGLSPLNITYDNNKTANKYASGYKTYEDPEVGVYAHAKLEGGEDATYQWYYVDDEGDWQAIDGETNDYILLDKDYMGLVLVCQASAAVGSGSDSASSVAFTDEVVASTRTIESVKVITKANYDAGKAKTAAHEKILHAGTTYYLVGIDSDGNVVNAAENGTSNYVWDFEGRTEYVKAESVKALGTDGVLIVTLKPNKKDYVGDSVSLTYKTAVSSEVEATFTITSDQGNVINSADKTYLIASTASTKLTAELNEDISIDEIAWYYATGVNKGGIKSAVATSEATLGLGGVKGSAVAAGDVYYVVLKDVDGNVYTSPKVQLAAPALASYTLNADDKVFTSTNADTGMTNVVDQFGVAVTTVAHNAANVKAVGTNVSGIPTVEIAGQALKITDNAGGTTSGDKWVATIGSVKFYITKLSDTGKYAVSTVDQPAASKLTSITVTTPNTLSVGTTPRDQYGSAFATTAVTTTPVENGLTYAIDTNGVITFAAGTWTANADALTTYEYVDTANGLVITITLVSPVTAGGTITAGEFIANVSMI